MLFVTVEYVQHPSDHAALLDIKPYAHLVRRHERNLHPRKESGEKQRYEYQYE